MESRVTDMTSGKPSKLILKFALPLMLGGVFQHLYTVVDAAIVGQFCGVNSLAALGSTDWLVWFCLGFCVGLTQGFAILIAQHFGAKEYRLLRKSVAMSIVLAAAIAVVMSVLLQILAEPVLRLLNTDPAVLDEALLYLRISYGGFAVVMAYNLLASVLRSLGDGTTPLVAMGVACAVNIGLDLLFVAAFHWGIGGAAGATVTAQLVSCLYCAYRFRKLSLLKFSKEDWRLDRPLLKKLFSLGSPLAVQNMVIHIGGMVLQSIINTYGVAFLAGFTATNKLYGALELAAIAFGYSIATYTGQNMGAEKIKRIKKGIRAATVLAIATSLAITALALIFSRPLTSLFINAGSENAQEALQVAMSYLAVLAVFLPILYLLNIYRSALQGLGDTITPFLSGMMELAMRLACAFTLPMFLGGEGLFLAEPAAWLGAIILLVPVYFIRERKYLNQMVDRSAEAD